MSPEQFRAKLGHALTVERLGGLAARMHGECSCGRWQLDDPFRGYIEKRHAEHYRREMVDTMKCELCGYPITRGHLFIKVLRACDDQGHEMEWDGDLYAHVGPCPAVPLAEPCLDD